MHDAMIMMHQTPEVLSFLSSPVDVDFALGPASGHDPVPLLVELFKRLLTVGQFSTVPLFWHVLLTISQSPAAVSYTHLTLPTIYSV